MKAASYSRVGAAREVLTVGEVDPPEPGPGQVRVRVRVSAVNPTDTKTRDGTTHRPFDGLRIPHQDGAGVIDAVGEGVDAQRVGQRVWLWLASPGGAGGAPLAERGTCAEYTVVPEHQASPLPDGASYDLGACLGVPALTAYHCLTADGPVDGLTVLVTGGAGAVGHYAIELARRAGARVVSTVSGPEKAELARKAGAEHVINYREGDPAACTVPKLDAKPTTFSFTLQQARNDFQMSSSSGPAQDPAGRRRASAAARTDGRSRSIVIVGGVSPGPAATAASRRTCGDVGRGRPRSGAAADRARCVHRMASL